MLRRLEPEESVAATSVYVGASRSEPIVAAIGDDAFESSLQGRERPGLVRDAVAISQRARELLARLKPIAIGVFGFWDHYVRSIVVAGRCVCVDPSGSYRIDP